MAKTRFTAEVDSETLAKATEILKRDQMTLADTLQEMLSHIVAHDTAPCFKCGEPNAETLEAMAEVERPPHARRPGRRTQLPLKTRLGVNIQQAQRHGPQPDTPGLPQRTVQLPSAHSSSL